MDEKSVVVNAFEKAVEGILDQAASTVLAKMKLEQLKTDLEIEKLSARSNTTKPQPVTKVCRKKRASFELTDSEALDPFSELTSK